MNIDWNSLRTEVQKDFSSWIDVVHTSQAATRSVAYRGFWLLADRVGDNPAEVRQLAVLAGMYASEARREEREWLALLAGLQERCDCAPEPNVSIVPTVENSSP